MKDVLLFVRVFLASYLLVNFIREVIARNPGGAVLFFILLAGYLVWIYRTRKYMFPTKHNEAGKSP